MLVASQIINQSSILFIELFFPVCKTHTSNICCAKVIAHFINELCSDLFHLFLQRKRQALRLANILLLCFFFCCHSIKVFLLDKNAVNHLTFTGSNIQECLSRQSAKVNLLRTIRLISTTIISPISSRISFFLQMLSDNSPTS